MGLRFFAFFLDCFDDGAGPLRWGVRWNFTVSLIERIVDVMFFSLLGVIRM